MQLEVKIFPTDGSPKMAEKIMEIGLEYFLGSCKSIIFEFANKKDANDFRPGNKSLGSLIEEDTVIIYPDSLYGTKNREKACKVLCKEGLMKK